MNWIQPCCICLQEVMLENIEYNQEREYKFYATIALGQRSKRGPTVKILKRNSTQKNRHKNNPPGGSSGGLPGWEKKGQYAAPKTYDIAGRLQRT